MIEQKYIDYWRDRQAQQAAALLKQEFRVQQVVVFGSLMHGQWFSRTSDVDLAVWGLDPDHYFVAVSCLQDISPEFKVDLVDVNGVHHR